jgi:hypothetical protein
VHSRHFGTHVLQCAGRPDRPDAGYHGAPLGDAERTDLGHPAVKGRHVEHVLGLRELRAGGSGGTADLIPAPDRSRGRWSAAVAAAALARIGEIVLAVGAIPDVGATRAAEILSVRPGVIVTPAGVTEPNRRGLIPEAGSFREWTLYDGRAIEAFSDGDLAEEAHGLGICTPPTTRPAA